MRFSDYAKESALLRTNEERLQDVAEREWVLPSLRDDKLLLVRVRVSSFGPDATAISLSVHTWHDQPGSTVALASGRKIEGGYFDFCHDPISLIDSEQLKSVVHARSVVERWVKGEIESLPNDLC